MEKIYFKNLNEYLNQEITIEGFVDSVRDLQYVQFLIIRDTSGKVQVTIEKNESNINWVIFAILLICCWPAALVYYLVKKKKA